MRAYILVLLVAVALVSLCVSQPADTGTTGAGQAEDISQVVTPVQTPSASQASIEPIVIQGFTEIGAEQCSLRKIEGKMLVIYAEVCADCSYVVDKIESYERELGTAVEYIDQEADANRLSALQISVPSKIYLPAVIIDCKVYTGNMGDRFYKEQMQAL
jgi:hypothetical protein